MNYEHRDAPVIWNTPVVRGRAGTVLAGGRRPGPLQAGTLETPQSGLVQGLRSVPCWKCGYLVIQSGLFLELEGRDGYHCRVVSWSDAHNAGILSQPFLRTLSDCWRVRPTYSKSAGYAYLGITCPKCGSLQGDNFVYDNYQGRGGVFSDPEDKSPLEVLPLPVFTDDWPQRFHWAFDSFSLDLEPWRIRFGKPVAIWGNAWPWSE